MKSIEEFRNTLKDIADLAFSNAINSLNVNHNSLNNPKLFDKEFQNEFVSKVHEGFKKAQEKLIVEVLYYQNLLQERNISLKEFRRQKNKSDSENTEIEIKVIKQRISNLSHIADSIAWQMIGGEIHIARRLFNSSYSQKFLASSNIQHAIKVAEEINKSPLNFALISDLTHFVQIGDLLIKQSNLVGLMELKEGKVNEQINLFFEELRLKKQPINEEILKNRFDENVLKQALRMNRQKERTEKIIEIINTDKGIDPTTNEPIVIKTPNIKTEGYHLALNKLYKDLSSNLYSYEVIEHCLHIGMYQNEGRSMAPFVIKHLLEKETENFILIDWLTITNNVSQPLFLKPFPPEFIIEVLTGKVKIIMGLNLDKLIGLFNSLGLKTRWVNQKEANKMLKGMPRQEEIFIINKKRIMFTIPSLEIETFLSGGILSKIFYDNILPSNIARTFLTLKYDDFNS
ncbi:hypothetical protein [Fontibacter flavus]|uniref:Uncharacterized protein n=1 Tax=Fontibacter flavus TaxID=654838 RepID=A0ABV6FVB0_9BACT